MGKQWCAGLISRGGVPLSKLPFTGCVVNVHWDDIEPEPGRYDFTEITAALDKSLAYGYPGIRLRLFGGIWAPQWLCDIAGSVHLVVPTQSGTVVGDVPLPWAEETRSAETRLLHTLACEFDTNPALLDVTFGVGVMTVYAEWPFFWLTPYQPVNLAAWLAAGYTEAAARTALYHSLNLHADLFTETRVYFANSLGKQSLDANGKPFNDLPFTVGFIAEARRLLGDRAIHGANGLGPGTIKSDLYQLIAAQGRPLTFQTDVGARLGGAAGLIAGLDWAVEVGAHGVEMPAGWDKMLTAQQMVDYSQRLLANRP
jgi:hypothetical protein